MIQRIQSVYFLLAGILPAFSFCVPMAHYTGANGEVLYSMNVWSMSMINGDILAHPWGIFSFAIISMVMSIVCIFAYKNRIRQIHLSNILLTAILLFALTFVAYGYFYGSEYGVRFLPSWGFAFPVLAYLFATLGRRAVCKDEELVRAADRIR